MMVTKKLDDFQKKWISGQKTAFSAQNSAFFYATPIKPPFFRLRRSRLNGIISPPYPEVTLDTFGFPVGGRLAARRTVSWPRLPKVALSGPKNAVFWPEIIFLCPASKKIVTIIAGHLKDNLFVLTALQGCLQGAVRAHFWAKKWPQNLIFLRYTYITRLFWSQTDPTQWDHNIPIS